MEKITMNAYLMFEGNCSEAIAFYQGIFGGEVQIMTFGQTDPSTPEHLKDKIMHAALMGGEVELMASDTPSPDSLGSGKITLALSGTDEAKLTNRFEVLSAGGTITVPLEKQMWGDLFGAFTDKYGVEWMVNIAQSPQ